MKMFQLYTTDSTHTYREYGTDYITTLTALGVLLNDKNFQQEFHYYFEKGLVSYSVGDPDRRGVINIKVCYIDTYEDEEETTFCLVPLKTFI